MLKYPGALLKLIEQLKKLPGVGTKSAERFAFHLLEETPHELLQLANSLAHLKERIKQCPECGCLMEGENCTYCRSPQRDNSLLCILAYPKEVYVIEETREFKGLYHVLGGLLSPLESRGTDKLSIEKLLHRINALAIKEVIIALDSTVEGDTTALYLKQLLAEYPVKVSRLAFGLPMGSSLDYVDGGTLAKALMGRQKF